MSLTDLGRRQVIEANANAQTDRVLRELYEMQPAFAVVLESDPTFAALLRGVVNYSVISGIQLGLDLPELAR